MTNETIILIADRNPRIRNFVERELRSEGYGVFSVETVSELMHWLRREHLPDLLVIDPDLPAGGAEDQLWPLLARLSHLPVVIHCLGSDIPMPMPRTACTVLVEKSASSIDLLKQQIRFLLRADQQK